MKPMRISATILGALAALAASACSPGGGTLKDGDAQTLAGIQADSKTGEAQIAASAPAGIGSVSYVEIKSTGVGPTPAAAVDDALYSAIRQVNGASVSGGTVQFSSATSIRSTVGDLDIASTGFAQAIVSQSQGSVTAFSVDEGSPLKIAPKAGQTGDQWQVSISAKVAKYLRPDSSLRPALVVAEPRLERIAVNVGSFSPDMLSSSLKQITEDAITGTNRFAVVNRDLTDEAVSELAIAQSALSPVEQGARIGQLLSAEVVVIPTIKLAKYEKNVRELRTSDRELVSYAGALVIHYDVINATTGQTIFSASYEKSPNTPKATTLGASVDAQSELEALLGGISSSFVADLNRRTFPISVIAIDGNAVVLSQGGSSLREGTSYKTIRKSSVEYVDPQTGQSLGRQETEIGTILVERVDTNLAYGTLNRLGSVDLADFKPGEIELRDAVSALPKVQEGVSPQRSNSTGADAAIGQKPIEEAAAIPQLVKDPPTEDPDW